MKQKNIKIPLKVPEYFEMPRHYGKLTMIEGIKKSVSPTIKEIRKLYNRKNIFKIGEIEIESLIPKKHKKPSLMRELVKKQLLTQDPFETLYYRGIPIVLRNDCPSGKLYLISDNENMDEDTIWAMRCMANDIEGKRTWPWSKLVWKIKRFINAKR